MAQAQEPPRKKQRGEQHRKREEQILSDEEVFLDPEEKTGNTDMLPIASLPELADRFQKQHGGMGQKGAVVKFIASDIKELKRSGFGTVESLAFPTARQLCEIHGISTNKAEVLLKLGQAVSPQIFTTATSVLEARQSLIKICTGATKLDALLQGGIETGAITEIFGEFRCGKTQLAHTLAVTSQLSTEDGGAAGKVLWIDTEGTFRPERIVDIAKRFKLKPEDVLDNILFVRANNSEQQSNLLIEAAAIMATCRFGLLIVDSVTHLYRSEFEGRGQLADRQQHLGRFLRMSQRLADEFGIAVLLTNQVMAKVDGAMYGPTSAPIGGHILAHACQTRLSLRKGKADSRICKIYDSPSIGEGESSFAISIGGVVDCSV